MIHKFWIPVLKNWLEVWEYVPRLQWTPYGEAPQGAHTAVSQDAIVWPCFQSFLKLNTNVIAIEWWSREC